MKVILAVLTEVKPWSFIYSLYYGVRCSSLNEQSQQGIEEQDTCNGISRCSFFFALRQLDLILCTVLLGINYVFSDGLKPNFAQAMLCCL